MRFAISTLTLFFIGCSNDMGPSALDAGPVAIDAGNDVVDAGKFAKDTATAVEAPVDVQAGMQEIYASLECPERLLSPDLEVRPTIDCSGADAGACSEGRSCRRSADCSARPFGRCEGFEYSSPDGGTHIETAHCGYDGCREDADCARGEACVCGAEGHRVCVAAPCRVDADCAHAGRCVRGDACGWGPFGAFVCTSDTDECLRNEDCYGKGGNSCTVGENGHLVCISIICD
ncbi:MAG TPA: hypothetical protein VG963_01370 [Polyangiaceae bacterium]|nr:hypothetical protein [Polyangiaceae bacterium]